MKFIGVDLGWVSGASGLCCLEWQDNQLQILDITTKLEVATIIAWIDKWTLNNEPALIAVDAPTIIPNQTGMRLPDKLTHQYFGRYHAGCYPANLSRPFAQRTINFGHVLASKGFNHAPIITPQKLGRYQIEVFPHPAIVNLFSLEKILKYKKGKLAEKTARLKKLSEYITKVLSQHEPKLNLNSAVTLPRFPPKLTGKELKALEDRLDSLICAYVAAYWWYWGEAKNLALGDTTTGYIIVPKRNNCDL
ncbi:MAG TPA: DUF429 domain-containing protein [Xenococcaceae cyanobacterium]